ncbi:MAG TPA: polysaccharide biosynthesis C-terminal domain-containing protein [Solirubrobacteraceae bacterium]|nr:polysaccharide biosynthesis C-terminal domain-containing protein [Solirubrobacteraceae bacterium]
MIRGSALRASAGIAGAVVGIATAALLLRHLGVAESGRYVTVISLLGIPVTVADVGLNVSASRWLALSGPEDRDTLIANVLGQRLLLMPVAVLAAVAFAAIAAYPPAMVAGTAIAGAGFFFVALANALLLRLTVELRNGGLALVDFLRQAITFVGVAALVALGASLAPFFVVQVLVGLCVVMLLPALIGRNAFVRPRWDREEQRMLLRSALPLAGALALGQLYFRLVIILMSLISSAEQTGYFGGSLRAIEAPIGISVLVAGVALPLLSAAARDDRERLRYAIGGLGRGAIVAGVLVVLVTVRAAAPLMALIGGEAFRPAGAVLRIQVGMLLFNALYQIWTMALLALNRQRELIGVNVLALAGLALFAAVLVPPLGARGGAIASVLGDALLACLIYWRVHTHLGWVMVPAGFLARVLVAAAFACVPLLVSGLPDFVAAALAGVVFLAVGQLIGMIPAELRAELRLLIARRPGGATPTS